MDTFDRYVARVYAVSARGLGAMESLFAVAILANLSFSLMAAIVIFALFATQLLVPDPAFRYYYSIFYVGLAASCSGKEGYSGRRLRYFSRRRHGSIGEALKRLAYR
jgi:hypothetical protein